MPLIPAAGSMFEHFPATDDKELQQVRKSCEDILKQMYHCRQCRADAAGTLDKDQSAELFEKQQEVEKDCNPKKSCKPTKACGSGENCKTTKACGSGKSCKTGKGDGSGKGCGKGKDEVKVVGVTSFEHGYEDERCEQE